MIRVIGFGNSLHGNDGFGEYVVNRMKRERSWFGVEFIFAGCAGLDAMRLFENVDEMIAVDVIHSASAKSDLAWYSKDEVIALDSERNDHGMGLGYLFRALDALDICPSIRCLLCRSESPKAFTLGMDPAIDQSIERAISAVGREIRNIIQQREASIE